MSSTLNLMRSLHLHKDIEEEISEVILARETPTVEEGSSEETPSRQNPTNLDQQANIVDEEVHNDRSEESATTPTFPEDHAKDISTEDSNLDDSNTSPEEITKSQKR